MNAPAESPLDTCLTEALALSRVWVPRWIGNLVETLHQRETQAANLHEKQGFMEARTALAGHRELLASRFVAELSLVIQGVGSVSGAGAGAPKRRSLSFDELELMDHDQVQETVEIARIQQVVKMAADEELVAFNARLCTAQGHEVVRSESNPMRPEVVVGALMKALAGMHVEEAVRARWLHAGALSLGNELQRFYQALAALLDGLGVQPAGYVVVQTGSVRRESALPSSSVSADSVPAAAMADGHDALLTLDHLHQLLVGNLEHSGGAVSDQGASGSGNAMVRTLAAEVVTQTLRRIAEDKRLLPPVREMVMRLKPSLLQLARSDPRFFADRHNPARRLLDAITSQGLAFTSEQDKGYAAYAQRVLETVSALQQPSANLSSTMETLLKRFTEGDESRKAPARGIAMQTLVRVEQRKLLAERVAAEIQSRNDFERAPGVVRRFILGPWAQVVAHARMDTQEHGAGSPADAAAHRYMDVLPDLLWSSQLAQASLNRPRLIKVIPGILRTLREGLDAIDYPRAQSESFFQALMGLHEAAYKTQRTEAAPPPESVMTPLDDEDEPWMHPEEARDTGFMDDLAIETQPAFLDTEPMSMGLEAGGPDRHHDEPSGPLAVGAWVDLIEQDTTLRCQLTWASPHGTMFLLSGPEGRSISLTKRGLERLQQLGRLRRVADHLVDEALDAVAQQALLNSGRR